MLWCAAGIAVPALHAQPADAQATDAWQEAWRLDLSRGASAPLVWADSLIVVASLDRNVHIVDPGPEPRIVWEENFDGGFEAAPLVTEDRIYLAEIRRGSRLVALDRGTHQTAWTAEAGDLVAPPILSGNTIYTVSSIGEVHAWDLSGGELWFTEVDSRVVSAPAYLEGVLVIAASDGVLFALDAATGMVRDSMDADAGPIWGHPVILPGPPPTALFATLEGQILEVTGDLEVLQRRSFPSRFFAGPIADGALFLIGHEGTLWAYDWAAAAVLWQRDLEGTFRASPAVADRTIAIGNLEGTFHVIDRATGVPRWQASLDGAITSQALAGGGTLYAVTERGKLYAFQRAGPDSRSGGR